MNIYIGLRKITYIIRIKENNIECIMYKSNYSYNEKYNYRR